MLEFNVQNQTITRTDSFSVVGDSKNYLKASFNCSDEWTGTITAVFDYGGKAYCVILPEDNTCTVPWEVIKPPYFTVSVFCGDLVTANVVSVKVEKSGYKEGETPSEPTPDIYRQILDSVKAPYIGENGKWYVWDAENKGFVDTGISSGGKAPERGIDYWTEEDKAEMAENIAPFIFDVELSDDLEITTETTYADIEEAYNAGKQVYVRVNSAVLGGSDLYIAPLMFVNGIHFLFEVFMGGAHVYLDCYDDRAGSQGWKVEWVEIATKEELDKITPVRGVNYWTEEDKAEIKAYVDEAILGGEW